MEVIFFPRNDYPNNVEICTHRKGKKMTFCELTTMIPKLVSDMFLPYIVELNRTHNIRVNGHFDNIRNGNPNAPYSSYLGEDVMDAISNDVIYPSLYFLSNPVNDYSEQAILGNKDVLWEWFNGKFGRYPSSLIYGLTYSNYGDYLVPYLLGSTTEEIDNNTDYGIGVGNPNNVPYSKSRYCRRNENVRSLDYAWNAQDRGENPWPADSNNYQSYIDSTASIIDQTMELEKGGLVTSFCHWHNILYLDINPNTGEVRPGREAMPALNNGLKAYFDMLASKNNNDEIYFAGYGEAIEYLIYRDSIANVAMYSPIGDEDNRLIIRLETRNVFNVDMSLIQTPVSVKFSIANTPLQNKTINSDCNLINLGSNNYIVEIPYSQFPKAEIFKINV